MGRLQPFGAGSNRLEAASSTLLPPVEYDSDHVVHWSIQQYKSSQNLNGGKNALESNGHLP